MVAIFDRDLPVVPSILTESLAAYPLIQLSFSYLFSMRLKFINLKFSKLSPLSFPSSDNTLLG